MEKLAKLVKLGQTEPSPEGYILTTKEVFPCLLISIVLFACGIVMSLKLFTKVIKILCQNNFLFFFFLVSVGVCWRMLLLDGDRWCVIENVGV